MTKEFYRVVTARRFFLACAVVSFIVALKAQPVPRASDVYFAAFLVMASFPLDKGPKGLFRFLLHIVTWSLFAASTLMNWGIVRTLDIYLAAILIISSWPQIPDIEDAEDPAEVAESSSSETASS